MKHIFLVLFAFLFHLSVIAQTPVLSEVKFRLYNEAGQLLTCDSMQTDSMCIIGSSEEIRFYEYDAVTDYHKMMINTFGCRLSFHWVRNGKFMDFFLNIYDTVGVSQYSFDRVQFEEGQYEIRVRNNADRETLEASKLKYFQNIEIVTTDSVQHFSWNSLKPFKVDSSDWVSTFFHPLDPRFMQEINCRKPIRRQR
jgi:hypothetical protein